MKTELIHSYSSSSLAKLSPSPNIIRRNNKDDAGSVSTIPSIDHNNDYPHHDEFEEQGWCSESLHRAFRKKNILKKFPILSWLPKYNTSKAISDTIAGITVGMTLIPQGLAMAAVAGLPMQYGLYSGFIGCFIYIVFGSTQAITIGPTAIMAIMTWHYSQGKPPEYAVLLCFVTGVITLFMGILQLGFIVNFISTPVNSAFSSAAAITICFTQIKALFGLKFPAEGFLEVSKGLSHHLSDIKVNDTLVSIVCIVVLLVLRKLQDLIKYVIHSPSPILDKAAWAISTSRSVIVIIACTLIFEINGDKTTVAFVGDVVPGLPSLMNPFDFNGNGTTPLTPIDPGWETFHLMDLINHDFSALIVLPLLGLMEHHTAAKMFAGTSRVDASQELITIGLSNIFGSFISSMPVTGAFSRTVVNKASGVETPMGGLVTGVLVIVALQFLTPYFYFIPKAALASVICCAVIFTIDFQIVYPMWKSKRMDIIPWFATFAVSLLAGLEYGILVGFMISVLFILYYAARPGIKVKKAVAGNGIEFMLLDLDRSLTFPSVEYTRYVITKCGHTWAKDVTPIVVDCQHIQFADFTASQGVRDLFKLFNEKNQQLILYQLKPSIIRIFTTALEMSNVPFKHAESEADLEKMLEASLDSGATTDIKITVTTAAEFEPSNKRTLNNRDSIISELSEDIQMESGNGQ